MNLAWRELLFENAIYKFIALIITLILWVTVLSRRDIVVTKTVDVEFVTGDKLVLLSEPRPSVEFRIAGSRIAMKKLEGQAIEPLQIDLSSVDPGRRLVSIPENSLALPLGAKVISVNPARLSIDLHTIMSRMFLVQAQFESADPGYSVVAVEPGRVQLRGAKAALDRVGGVVTQPIRLESGQITGAMPVGRNEFVMEVLVEMPMVQGVVGINPASVKVRVKVNRSKVNSD